MSYCLGRVGDFLQVASVASRLCSPLYAIHFSGLKKRDRKSDFEAYEQTNQLPHKSPSLVPPPTVTDPLILSPSATCSFRRVAPRQVWVESLNDEEERYIDIIDLHPDVFATFPRLDLVHKNLYWQAHYRIVDWRCITTRADLLHRCRRKPWPQKGTGRARHGNRRTHIFIGGGQCNGPRGPESYFSILPYHVRLNGLLSMLSVKQAQGDLHVVKDFGLSSELESAAVEVYKLANRRAADRLQLSQEEIDDDAIVQRLQLKKYAEEEEMHEMDILTSSIIRQREEAEELRDLIKGGRSAQAANLGLRAANYLRRVADERGWGPAVLFITDVETYLNEVKNSASGLAMALACASYAHYVDMDVAPESATIQGRLREGSPYAAPRSMHPGRGLTLMPVHGLNVWSMVHHDSLVVTRKALDLLESRLLSAQRRVAHQPRHVKWHPPLAGDWVGRSGPCER